MLAPTFESFSQNGEDVVLWRALHEVRAGRYIDVGANHPQIYSVSMGFYNRGWSGIVVEPDPAFAQMLREERPRDLTVEAAVTANDRDTVTFHVVDGTGLSTLDAGLADTHAGVGYDTHDVDVATRTIDSILDEAGWRGSDIHFMSIDTEGSERGVLESIDFGVWRPWILVVEATSPLSTTSSRELWEDLVQKADYRFCLFDGLSCYYVANEHADSFSRALSYPSCVLDDYTTREYREATRERHQLDRKVAELQQDVAELVRQVTRWRTEAVNRWATAMATETELAKVRAELSESYSTIGEMNVAIHLERSELHKQILDLRTQIEDLRSSTSWQVTRPLRFLGGQVARSGPRQ